MKVNVYTTPTCGHCKRLKEYLNDRDVPYTEFDVTEDFEKAKEMVKKTGQMGVPVLEVDGEYIVGFDEQEVEKLLKQR